MNIVKFKKKLTDFDYIIGIDLALYHTGVSVYDIKKSAIIATYRLDQKNSQEDLILHSYEMWNDFIKNELVKKYPKSFLVKEAMPMQAGFKSSIGALFGLKGIHTILDLVCMQNNIAVYDEVGVHSISVKSLFKTAENKKPTKTDIGNSLKKIYDLSGLELTDDITDSIAVIYCLLNKKWTQDICDNIKELKKHKKTLSSSSAIQKIDEEIQELEQLKI